MYRNEKTVYYFLLKVRERSSERFLTYMLTIDFSKNDRDKNVDRFYTLRNALDYIFNKDPNAIVLAREELYGDGVGYHIHAIIITSEYVNFSEFHKYAKYYAKIWANFHIKFVSPGIENILRVVSYVVKNKEEVKRVWEKIIEED